MRLSILLDTQPLIDKIPSRWQTIFFVLLAYTFVFFILYPVAGSGAVALVMIPVVVSGWLLGWKGGLIAGILAFPYNTLLLNLSGETGWYVVFQVGGLPGVVSVIGLGAIAGYFHGLNKMLQVKLAETVQAQQEMEVLESRFRTLAENIDEIVWMITPDGKTTLYVNPAFESVTGYSTYLLHENPQLWASLIHKEDKQHVLTRLQTDTTDLLNVEYRLVRKDGNIRWLWHRVKPVRDNNGVITARIITAQDITERILIEDQAMELTLQKERTEILEKLIRNVSHDFRTPLTNINISLYMLKKSKDEENQATRTEIISEQVERIRVLVDDMMAMIRVDKDTLTFQAVDINSILTDVKTRLEDMPRKRKITLTLALEDNIPEMQGDKDQIFLALSHLLMYMMLYSKEGTEIIIHTRSDGTYTSINVTDPNMGISADKLERIFEPFYKIESVRSTAVGRSGLGLAMTKKIIERHGGHVSVESDVNTGSVFRVLLPVSTSKDTMATSGS